MVRAAGGLVWRAGATGGLEVVVVHRPRYDDWSWPKGKLEPGEDFADAARREVLEETGLRCASGPELPAVRYRDQRGRPKTVRYWAMTVVAEEPFEPGHEVDRRDWLAPAAARERLSYDHDRRVLDALLELVGQHPKLGPR